MLIDRLNILRERVGLGAIQATIVTGNYCDRTGAWIPNTLTPLHTALDEIDQRVGIRTRHKCARVYTGCAIPYPQSEYVGARLARLERHVKSNKAPSLFWLGAEGEGEINPDNRL